MIIPHPKKGDGLLCQRNEVKYSFIAQHKKIWPITLMCKVLEVNSSNYYSFQRRKANKIADPEHDDIIELKSGGPLVGMFKEAKYTSGHVILEEDDILSIFTDGVIEAMNIKDDEFSEERFLEIVIKEKHKPLLGIMLELFNELRRFCGDVPYGDDITLLFLRKKPEGEL